MIHRSVIDRRASDYRYLESLPPFWETVRGFYRLRFVTDDFGDLIETFEFRGLYVYYDTGSSLHLDLGL